MAINKQYSYKGFPYHGLSFKNHPAAEFNNSSIIGSCFYQQWLDDGATMKDIFPVGMTGVTFSKCNLDNVYVPPGNTIDGGTHNSLRAQNDMEDWLVDAMDKPIGPLHPKRFDDVGLSKDPKDIPTDFLRRETLCQKEYGRIQNDSEFARWWKQTPKIVSSDTQLRVSEIPMTKWNTLSLTQRRELRKNYDGTPIMRQIDRSRVTKAGVVLMPVMQLSGSVTILTLEAPGYFMRPGVKPRKMRRRPLTMERMIELRKRGQK